MSERASSWVLGHSEVEGVLRLVLFVLAFNASTQQGDGRIRPGRVAKQARIPDEHVEVALKALVAIGAITYGDWNQRRNGRSGRTFGYRVIVPDDYREHE